MPGARLPAASVAQIVVALRAVDRLADVLGDLGCP